MLSLGKGFYEFTFVSKTDLCIVSAAGTVNLKPGVLPLFQWTKDFYLHTQRNTHPQVWIQLMALPQEYWMDRTLREIDSALGTPLLIDNATTKLIHGHYARILVDMDFSWNFFHEITVEMKGQVAYEWLPDFCMLEQNVFNIKTLSFDDNKLLKSQLDMLIFVQVCRTIKNS